MKPTISAHVDDYLSRLSRTKAERTVMHQGSVLRPFARWRDKTGKSARTLTRWEVEDYLIGPDGLADHVSATTWNVYKAVVLKFLRWGADRGAWTSAVLLELEDMQAAPRPKVYLDDDQMDWLQDHARDAYERFCIAALRYTLCREKELLAVPLSRIDRPGNRMMIIRTKGRRANPQDKIDRIPIVGELNEELDRWLPVYEELCGPLQPNWYLIPRRKATPEGRRGKTTSYHYWPDEQRDKIGIIVKKGVARLMPDLTADELRGVGSHTLRRSGGLEMREALRDAGETEADHEVMAMYGHANVQTSYNYWGEDRDRARRDVALGGRRLRPKKATVTQLKVVEDAG